MRVFLAFAISPKVRQEIDYLQAELVKIAPKLLGRIRWVNGADAHITTHFFGDLESSQIDLVKQAVLGSVKTCAPFSFVLGKVAGFPGLNFLQTLVVEVNEPGGDESTVLQADICRKLYEAGVPFDEKPWRPHLTMGRIKNASSENFMALANFKVEPVELGVSSIELIASELTPSGPKYTVLQSFKFGL